MSPKIVRTAAIQIRPTETSVEKTIQHAVKLAKIAIEREADIICLPEHWLPEKKIPPPQNPIPELQTLAEQNSVVIIGGAFYERVEGKMRLSSPVIGEDGRLLGRQFKVHLFYSERKIAKPGNSYNVFEMFDYKTGILVCYDVDFPEPSRIYALNGVELILCPSRIVRPGIAPWQQYVTVRCLENRMPIVAPNVYAPPWFTGHSMIISLREDPRTKISHPRIATTSKKGAAIVMQDIDLSVHNRLRQERFADRRPETYR